MSGVPKHLRTPRRWYDADGVEQPAATIANSKANRARGLLVFCECGRESALPFEGLPDDAVVPDVALRLVCTGCGRKDRIATRPDFTGTASRPMGRLRGVA